VPYIKKIDRANGLDASINEVVADLKRIRHWPATRKGAANYAVTRIVLASMKPNEGWSYTSISRALAVLDDAHGEMKRRLMDVREDKAIERNGDVPEYMTAFEDQE